MSHDKPDTGKLRNLIEYLIRLQEDNFKLLGEHLNYYTAATYQFLSGWNLREVARVLKFREEVGVIKFPDYTYWSTTKIIGIELGIPKDQINCLEEMLLDITDNTWYYGFNCEVGLGKYTCQIGYLRYKTCLYEEMLFKVVNYFKEAIKLYQRIK